MASATVLLQHAPPAGLVADPAAPLELAHTLPLHPPFKVLPSEDGKSIKYGSPTLFTPTKVTRSRPIARLQKHA